MKDDKPAPDAKHEDLFDRFDEGVVAADDTGMLAGEQAITQAEIAEAEAEDKPKR